MLNIYYKSRSCQEPKVPHILIEHSANLDRAGDIGELVKAVHAAALDHGLASVDALRTRSARRDHFVVADNHPSNAFVAIIVRVGPGRSSDDKQSFIHTLLDAAEQALSVEVPLAIAWSIELQEIDPTARVNRNYVRQRIAAEST